MKRKQVLTRLACCAVVLLLLTGCDTVDPDVLYDKITSFIRDGNEDFPANGYWLPGRDTKRIWGNGRYHLIDQYEEWGFSLYRWEGREENSPEYRISGDITRFYIDDDFSYFEAREYTAFDEEKQRDVWVEGVGYIVIDHTTHEFPVFVSYDELEERHRLVFDDTKRFTYAHPQ